MPSTPLILLFATAAAASASASPITFTKQIVDPRFFAEGVAVADLNRDGHPDLVAGPYWFAGPDFVNKREIRAPLAYHPESYSDTFIAATHDFDGDGWIDILQMGWPGREAFWFKNPGTASGDWPRHLAFSSVGGESPTLHDLTGDGIPEIVCISGKRIGWASPDPRNPTAPWRFEAITPEGDWGRYHHGLGIGDLNGDGRADIITARGWWEQPAKLGEGGPWLHHPADFGAGGAQMYAYDVNGDGRADVISSIEAHKYGLSWFEQLPPSAGQTRWQEHPIVSRNPAERLQGVQFSQPHAVQLADVDGDGLNDIVVGKRYWAHGPKGDPEVSAAPVVYWFRLVREVAGSRFEPALIDDDSGVGTQLEVTDFTGDGRPDIAAANKRGVFVFRQRRSP